MSTVQMTGTLPGDSAVALGIRRAEQMGLALLIWKSKIQNITSALNRISVETGL
jgi:hypothetical protein